MHVVGGFGVFQIHRVLRECVSQDCGDGFRYPAHHPSDRNLLLCVWRNVIFDRRVPGRVQSGEEYFEVCPVYQFLSETDRRTDCSMERLFPADERIPGSAVGFL